MFRILKNHLVITVFFLLSSCVASSQLSKEELLMGAEQTQLYVPNLVGKRVALVVNHTSVIRNHQGSVTHLADSLQQLGVNLTLIFAPEHGFRGTASAGEHVANGVDTKTKLPLISLYGSNKKPTASQLKDIDVVIFDIQDVGARFYTYISTMNYVMEACAENNKEFIVLDRPNPNGHYIDGPVLEKAFSSFVGLNPIPVVHGCTVGELATLINGEGWLKNGVRCNLSVVTCANYRHNQRYSPPIAPSPNLPNLQSILLYPSLCLFEGTDVSVGRGTDTQFQVIGSPVVRPNAYTFTPEDKVGAVNPMHEGKKCYGLNLTTIDAKQQGFTLKYLLDFYQKSPDKTKFFTTPAFFDKLAGTDTLRKQILAGKTESQIRKQWTTALNQYKQIRAKYLLYE